MVHVEPVVCRQQTVKHLVVIDDVERNLGVCQDERHGIVPREYVFGGVNGETRHLLQLHLVHIHSGVGNLIQDRLSLHIGDDGKRHITQPAFSLKAIMVRDEIASTPIVKQPAYLHIAFKDPISNTIGLQVV